MSVNYTAGAPLASLEKVNELFAGTGGNYINVTNNLHTFGEIILEKITKADAVSYIETMQKEIQDTFGITISDIADACGVARKTAYNWREERSIVRRHKGMDRLFLISQAAKNWQDSGNSPLGSKFYDYKYFGDTSLKDLLTADEIDLEKIEFLGTRYTLAKMR